MAMSGHVVGVLMAKRVINIFSYPYILDRIDLQFRGYRLEEKGGGGGYVSTCLNITPQVVIISK